MIGARWFAMVVATLIWAIALWFGFVAIATSRTVALAVVAIGLVFALYALTGLSGAPDAADRAFRSALVAIGAGSAMLLAHLVTDLDWLVVASPVIASAAGAHVALTTSGVVATVGRAVVAVGFSVVVVLVYRVDPTVYGLIAPFPGLLAIPVGDAVATRVGRIVAEAAPD